MVPLQYLPPTADGLPAALLALPPNGPATRLMVSVHGHARQPLEHLEAFAAPALARGWALLLPVYDEHRHRRYARLAASRRAMRADLALIARVESLRGLLPADGWRLFGYSAGAQFAHRFALRHPGRLHALALGAAGWYTWPDPGLRWPLGLQDGDVDRAAVDLDGFLRLPRAGWVGERDHGADEFLRPDAQVIERARRWCAAMDAAAAARGIGGATPLHLVPRAAHSFAACARRGGMAEAVVAFFDAC
jgi:pimeloyl-ACP methyl ester carboxylesterase